MQIMGLFGRRTVKSALVITRAILLFGILVGCGTAQGTGYTTVAEETLKPGDLVPTPSGPVILTLTGKIGITNVAPRLDFDLTTLERVGLVTYEVNDPELRRTVKYTGVLLKRVLDIARLAPTAKELSAGALDDYKTVIPLDINRWPVMIATYRDDQRIPSDAKGPIEIVFPNKQFNIDKEQYDRMWVWQLRTLTVR